ncbi:MAG: glycine rich domain-containing protein [Bacteroidota bacterium]
MSLIFSHAQVVMTFEYSGSPQNWVVPPGVFSVDLEVYGASGGSASTVTMGGPGGFAQGTLDVTPGTLLYLYVGGEGQVNTGEPINGGGWNGGGDALGSNSFIRGGGGGASDVRVGGSSLHDRVIVAAGGGGTGGDGLPGGAGGGLNGGPGYHNPTIGGGGGSINQGGLPSINSDGQGGSFGQGGYATNSVLLAGGGAGWYGGGSGGAGGGGSSYIGGVRDGSTASTPRRGNGQIILSYILPENNDVCETPSPINCNEIITADTRTATPDPNTCTGHTDGGGGLWYSFIGTGEEVTVTTDFEATDFDTRLSVYTALCDELICIAENDNVSISNTNSQISFFAAEGGIYRILVDGPQFAEGNFQLAVICGNPCEQARPLSCFESLTGNTSKGEPITSPISCVIALWNI